MTSVISPDKHNFISLTVLIEAPPKTATARKGEQLLCFRPPSPSCGGVCEHASPPSVPAIGGFLTFRGDLHHGFAPRRVRRLRRPRIRHGTGVSIGVSVGKIPLAGLQVLAHLDQQRADTLRRSISSASRSIPPSAGCCRVSSPLRGSFPSPDQMIDQFEIPRHPAGEKRFHLVAFGADDAELRLQ